MVGGGGWIGGNTTVVVAVDVGGLDLMLGKSVFGDEEIGYRCGEVEEPLGA